MQLTDPTDPTFKLAARAAARSWKRTTPTLHDEARHPGPYDKYPALPFCLPDEHRVLNLLPGARPIALDRFAAAGIEWHAGQRGLPSNHLLDSQVQCVNTLAPLVDDPDALRRLFGTVLPIAEVLPFGATDRSGGARLSPYDATDHVVFEWQGLNDHFGEWSERTRRGSMATSSDAAIRYRSVDGTIEMALVEWKYTESYDKDRLDGSNDTRDRRYLSHFVAGDSPITPSTLELADCYAEPVYQLMRFTLLARAIERHHELGVDRCRVVYVAPRANTALFSSRGTPRFAGFAAGRPFDDVWTSVLRRPDDVQFLDSARLLLPDAPVDDEFRVRYSALAGSHTETAAGSALEEPPGQ